MKAGQIDDMSLNSLAAGKQRGLGGREEKVGRNRIRFKAFLMGAITIELLGHKSQVK